MKLPPADSAVPSGAPVSGSTPAGVTDHSSYELGVTVGREQAAKIAEDRCYWCLKEYNYDAGFMEACKQIAEAIRRGE